MSFQTPFKKVSEYAIILVSLITLFRLKELNKHFETDYLRLFAFAIIFGIIAESIFTLYIRVDDLPNGLGHLFYLLSSGLFSIFVIKEGLDKPYTIMFHKIHRQAIRDSLTGLYSRNGVYEIVNASFGKARRYSSVYRIFVIVMESYSDTAALATADEALLKAKAIKHPERANSKRDEPWRLDRYTED